MPRLPPLLPSVPHMHASDNAMQPQKIEAEIAKLIAETAKINAEAKRYPFVMLAGVFCAALAVVKLFLH